ncbi:MAG: class I SAM-dependent methyltransferase [Polyangiales bacterium]
MTKLARNDFDAVSTIYDSLAGLVFAGAIRRSQLELLPQIDGADKVLIIGGGTGWFLLELLKRTTAKQVVYLELSKDMLRKSRALVEREAPEHLHRVEFRHGTEQSLGAEDGHFDVIATNFFLACFGDENCTRVVTRLHPFLAPQGRWLFVDFQYPERGWARLAALVLFKVMFTFFNLVSDLEARRPPDYELGFRRVGLRASLERPFFARMIRARLLAQGAAPAE